MKKWKQIEFLGISTTSTKFNLKILLGLTFTEVMAQK